MVFTVTLNPALDRTLMLEELKINEVNRVRKSRSDIGGKGINVSKVLKVLGTPSVAMGFIGDNHKEIFRAELDGYGIISQMIPVKGDTRTNVKIADEKNGSFTDLNEEGPEIRPEEMKAFLALFDRLVKEKDIVVLSGSIPKGVDEKIYGELIEKSVKKGAYVVVDTEGESLRHAAGKKPQIMKPNEQEFLRLTGKEEASEEEIIQEAMKLIEGGVERVLVSLGMKGSIFVTENQVLKGEPLEVKVKSTVGAGDAMVAALVHAKVEGLGDLEAFMLAQAAAAATVMREGTMMPRRENILRLLVEAEEKIHVISRKRF